MAKTGVVLDAVTVDPKHYSTEHEDDRIRLVRAKYAPGEKSQMHSHPDLVVVCVVGGDVRFTFPDGTAEEVHMTPGQAMFMPATTHLPENIGSQALEVVLVEFKA